MNFNKQVYEIVSRIPRGQVCTYGHVALLAGSPRASRIVGLPCCMPLRGFPAIVSFTGTAPFAATRLLAARRSSGRCWRLKAWRSCRTGGWI